MEHARSRELRNAGAWAITVAGHLLLMMIFVIANRSGTRARTTSGVEPVSVLIDMSTRPLAVGEVAAKPKHAGGPQPAATARPLRADRIRHGGQPPATVTAAATVATVAGPAAAPIDWNRESLLASQRLGAPDAKVNSGTFSAPLSSATHLCKKSRPKAPWNKELRTAGFIGGLPYVRLGRRCLVGLPFFGCAIGHLPDADTQLFANMDGADRVRSSVPDFPDCVPAGDAVR